MTVPDLPNPCTPGQIYTLKGQCASNGEGGVAFWLADPTSIDGPPGFAAASQPHPLVEILAQMHKMKVPVTFDQILQLTEKLTPKVGKCGG